MSRRSPIGVGDDGFVRALRPQVPAFAGKTEVGVCRKQERGLLKQAFEAGQYDAAQRGGLFSESFPVFRWLRATGFRIKS